MVWKQALQLVETWIIATAILLIWAAPHLRRDFAVMRRHTAYLFAMGADVITLGNHAYRHRDAYAAPWSGHADPSGGGWVLAQRLRMPGRALFPVVVEEGHGGDLDLAADKAFDVVPKKKG